MKTWTIQSLPCFSIILLGVILPLLWVNLSMAAPDILSLEEIEAGMTGIGRSVFKGYDIEEFPVEIISIIPNINPGQNLILGRLGGEFLEKSGVMQGISGSPVYIDGKIIGAISSSWSFSREPLAGITPIEEMLTIFEKEQSAMKRENYSGTNSEIIIRNFNGTSFSPPPQEFLSPFQDSLQYGRGLEPLQLPVFVSGLSPQLIQEVDSFFSKANFQMVTGSQQKLQEKPVPEIKPGASVGVDFVRGDLSMATVGTLTYMDGNKILAFGHPMFQLGKTEFPLMHAYVHTVMPSDFISFKIASTTKPIGTLIQDRISGVMGVTGNDVDMLPLDISVRYKGSATEKKHHFEIVRNPVFTPFMAYLSLLNTLTGLEKATGEVTFTIRSELRLKDKPTLIMENMYSSFNAFSDAGGEVLTLFSVLRNPFVSVTPESLEISIEIEERIKISSIKECRMRQHELKAGDIVDLQIKLQPYQKGEFLTQKVSFTLPERLQPGMYKITIADSSWHFRQNLRRTPHYFSLFNLEHYYRLLSENVQNNKIYVSLSQFRPGMTLRGENYNNLPSTMVNIVQPAPQSGEGSIFRESIIEKRVIDCDSVINGFKFLTFRITE